MAANKIFRFGPIALTTTLTTNILNCTITSLAGPVGFAAPSTAFTQPYMILRHIRIVNKTGSNATFTLYMGATNGNVAGTELLGTATVVSANSAFDWYGLVRMDVADFLVGGAGTTTALTIEGEGEIGFV